jgi:hypothetical protein
MDEHDILTVVTLATAAVSLVVASVKYVKCCSCMECVTRPPPSTTLQYGRKRPRSAPPRVSFRETDSPSNTTATPPAHSGANLLPPDGVITYQDV